MDTGRGAPGVPGANVVPVSPAGVPSEAAASAAKIPASIRPGRRRVVDPLPQRPQQYTPLGERLHGADHPDSDRPRRSRATTTTVSLARTSVSYTHLRAHETDSY